MCCHICAFSTVLSTRKARVESKRERESEGREQHGCCVEGSPGSARGGFPPTVVGGGALARALLHRAAPRRRAHPGRPSISGAPAIPASRAFQTHRRTRSWAGRARPAARRGRKRCRAIAALARPRPLARARPGARRRMRGRAATIPAPAWRWVAPAPGWAGEARLNRGLTQVPRPDRVPVRQAAAGLRPPPALQGRGRGGAVAFACG